VPFPASTQNEKATPIHLQHWQSQWHTTSAPFVINTQHKKSF
jgi:hypothetical protein